MDIVDPNIEKYCLDNSEAVHPALYRLERETHLKTLAPQMLSGQLQGQFLRLACQMARPQRILEIGTFTGYSANSMALGAPQDVHIDTIEANEELEGMIREYLEAAGVTRQVSLHIGDALEIIPRLNGPYDLAFIDGAKPDYAAYFEQVVGKMKPGGFILSDNVLWDGKVLQYYDDEDADAAAIRAYNRMLHNDPRVEVLILPIRDGISIARVIRNEVRR
jgi:predicted O-methyltransferase YrrM